MRLNLRLLGFAALCALMVSSPLSAQINLPGFSPAAGMVLNGNAALAGSTLELTQDLGTQAGSAWFPVQQSVTAGFTTTFAFQMSGSGGADGMTFVIQDDVAGTAALGGPGSAMGAYSPSPVMAANSILNSLIVELDTYNAGGDPSGNNISVHLIPTLPTTAQGFDEFYSIGQVTPTITLNDGQTHVLCVRYTLPGTLEIFLDDLNTAILTIPFTFAGGAMGTNGLPIAGLNFPLGNAWLGFTGGTGGLSQSHQVLAWSFGAGNCDLSGPWETNAPESSTDVDGVLIPSSFAGPAVSNLVNGANGTLNISTTLFNSPFELVIGAGAAVAGNTAPGFFTAGGQAVNVNLAGAFYLNGGGAPLLLPHPGAISAPFTLPTPVVVHAQQVVIDPAAADLFSLSQCAEARGVTRFCINSPTAINTGAGDDTSFNFVFTAGSFPFYGTFYTDCFVNSNGNITFGAGDSDFGETEAAMLAGAPRIAATWNDLSPNVTGEVNVEEAAGLATITWWQVPEFNTPNSENTFCASLDLAGGTIVLGFDDMTMNGGATGLVGISPGGGMSLANNVDLNVGPNVAVLPTDAIYEDFNLGVFGPYDLENSTHTYLPGGGPGLGPYLQQ